MQGIETREASNETNASGQCSTEELQRVEQLFKQSQEVERYFYLSISLMAIYLNARLLALALCGDAKRSMLSSKIALLAIFALVGVLTMMLDNLDRYVEQSAEVLTSFAVSLIFCKIPTYLYIAANLGCTWVVTIMAIQRYLAVRYPFKVHRYDKRTLRIEILALVVFPLFITLPKLFTVSNNEAGGNVLACMADGDGGFVYRFDSLYSAILFALSTLIPVAVLVVFSMLLAIEIDRVRQRSIRLTNSQSFESSAARYMQSTVMTLVLAATYAVLQLPDVLIWVCNYGLLVTGDSDCLTISVLTTSTYVSLLRDLVAITNPGIFLLFKWLSERSERKAASINSKLPSNMPDNPSPVELTSIVYYL